MKTPPLGAVDVTGGVSTGGPAWGGVPAPDSIACIAPDDNPCAPAPAGCPVAMPDANDCAKLGEVAWPSPADDIGMALPGTPGIRGDIGPPLAGKWTPGDGATPCPPGTEPLPNPAPETPLLGDGASGAEVPPKPAGDAPGKRPCGDGASGTEPPPTDGVDDPRSAWLIGRGEEGLSALKPFSRAQVRASPPTPSTSRIFWVAVVSLSTAFKLAFAASALQRNWTACTSATCSGSGFFDARIASISLLPVFAISANRLRK